MKQVLFILLVFISFQGFAQKSVKLKEIGLQVMEEHLGKMDWDEAKKMCEDLGKKWRLPTKDELYKMYKYKDLIGGFKDDYYWSSTEGGYGDAWLFNFRNGNFDNYVKFNEFYVLAVRDL